MKRTRKKVGTLPFGKILRAVMEERKITVREAATIAGVGASTIDDWRGGAAPADYSAVKRLASALGVSFSFLLTGEDESKLDGIKPLISEVFDDGGALFDGYAKITIMKLLPRKREDNE